MCAGSPRCRVRRTTPRSPRSEAGSISSAGDACSRSTLPQGRSRRPHSFPRRYPIRRRRPSATVSSWRAAARTASGRWHAETPLSSATVPSDYVYTMYRADKFYGPDRQVLANISLSFLPGAKIGVLGPNGAGKSTLLRIMAGRDEPSSGVAELAPGATVGLLEQEPELDPAKD